MEVPKYLHTPGTLYMHTSGTQLAHHFDRVFEKISDVPFVCHMYVHTWGAPGMLLTEKYGQFPFERTLARQNWTFLAPCGFI